MSTDIPEGWYPDHTGEPQERWWDGQAWSERTRPQTAAAWPTDDQPFALTSPQLDTGPTTAPPMSAPEASTVSAAAFTPPPVMTSGSSKGGGAGRWVLAAVGALVLATFTGVAGFVIGRSTAVVERFAIEVEEPFAVPSPPDLGVPRPVPIPTPVPGQTLDSGIDGGGFIGDGPIAEGPDVARGGGGVAAIPENGDVRFPLQIDEAGTTTITVTPVPDSSDVDPVTTLLDADGMEIADNDDGFGSCCASQIVMDLEPGDYTVVVRSFGGFSTGDVEVTVD